MNYYSELHNQNCSFNLGHISSINSRQFIPNSSSNPSSNNPSSISFK